MRGARFQRVNGLYAFGVFRREETYAPTSQISGVAGAVGLGSLTDPFFLT